jgi:hypothetical protein
MSSIIGKEFRNKSNNDVIKVATIEGNIAILENDHRISIERLLDTNYYVVNNGSMINENTNVVSTPTPNIDSDVDRLMNGSALYNSLFRQIKSLDDETVNRANDVGGIQIDGDYINPVESHSSAQQVLKSDNVSDTSDRYSEMIEEAKRNQLNLDAKMRKQAALLGKTVDGIESEVTIPVNNNLNGVTYEGDRNRDTSVKVIDEAGHITSTTQPQPQPPIPTTEPINPMFAKMKRTQKVNLKIDINEMVPTKDLLKMLEEGFEDSVLDYLTDEIAGKVLSDETIKSQIKKKLTEYVYGKPRTPRTPTKKTPTKKTPAKKTNIGKS